MSTEVFACYSKSCAPPPVGSGGSSKSGGGSSTIRVTRELLKRTSPGRGADLADDNVPGETTLRARSIPNVSTARLRRHLVVLNRHLSPEGMKAWEDTRRALIDLGAKRQAVKHELRLRGVVDSHVEMSVISTSSGTEVFACYSKACAPPPTGKGGSSKGGVGGAGGRAPRQLNMGFAKRGSQGVPGRPVGTVGSDAKSQSVARGRARDGGPLYERVAGSKVARGRGGLTTEDIFNLYEFSRSMSGRGFENPSAYAPAVKRIADKLAKNANRARERADKEHLMDLVDEVDQYLAEV